MLKIRWSLLIAFGLFAGAGVLGDSMRSPFVEERLNDAVEWRDWNADTRRELSEGDKLGLLTISHELSSLSFAMGKETYRNEEIAKKINEGYVPIAIDKNVHPQLANYYAAYARNAKQFEGWPLTIIVTPELKPVEGGGYYPPTDDWGSQGLSSLVTNVGEQWLTDRRRIEIKAEEAVEGLLDFYGPAGSRSVPFEEAFLEIAVENLGYQYDAQYGGFGMPPKAIEFDSLRILDAALVREGTNREQAESMRTKTAHGILNGVGRDYVRGGFFEAVTDESWSLPDFRRELPTQAQAIRYLSQFDEYEVIAKRTAASLLEAFRADDHSFVEAIAFNDSSGEGIEANSWHYERLESLLESNELEAISLRFGLKPEGNVSDEIDITETYKGRNLLKIHSEGGDEELVSAALEKLKESLGSEFGWTRERVSSVETNALASIALIAAGETSLEKGLLALDGIIETYWDADSKRLSAAVFDGNRFSSEASAKGYALFVRSLLVAFEHAPEKGNYFELAKIAQTTMDEGFGTDEGPYTIGRVDTSDPGSRLYAFVENETGSANSIALGNLARLEKAAPGNDFRNRAVAILKQLPEEISYAPEQYADLLLEALSFAEGN